MLVMVINFLLVPKFKQSGAKTESGTMQQLRHSLQMGIMFAIMDGATRKRSILIMLDQFKKALPILYWKLKRLLWLQKKPLSVRLPNLLLKMIPSPGLCHQNFRLIPMILKM
ncbi:hypothetical protein PHJA_001651400 [Phtheirospermum japonicum]|uniref:Uncharacterized protein n=1 Tax=Phtheirospermum japonicum TaxID=374723 RepID=A0A830C610_9LAMI|nr:hypothetical protein PHJA_001651400 [Phtheirospermum japonicum]